MEGFMGESVIRTGLRGSLVAVVIVAALIGGFYWYSHLAFLADRSAVRAAYMEGRLTREEARRSTGEDVDQWPEPTPKADQSK
jgi:hypothetical protein